MVLETIFDNQDRSQVDASKYDAKDLEEVNLGTKETPKKCIWLKNYHLRSGKT